MMILEIRKFLINLAFLICFHNWVAEANHRNYENWDRIYRQTQQMDTMSQTTSSKLETNSNMGTMIMKKLDQIEQKMNETITDEQRENEQLIKLLSLPEKYNKFELPRLGKVGNFSRVKISVGVRIRNIRAIDVLNEEIGMELDLVAKWIDQPIKNHHKNYRNMSHNLDSGFLKEIWWPNLIFSRTVSVVRPDLHGSYLIPRPVRLIISPRQGLIEMSSRIVLKIYCPMNFIYYPADTQSCDIRLRSYAETTDDIDLNWDVVSGSGDPVPQAYFSNRGHPNYDIHMHNVTTVYQQEVNVNNRRSLNFTYLQFTLSTRRKLSFHIMQTYIPSIFLVVITWLAFFIPIELLEARIGISMTILLTLTAMFGSIKEYTPPVSYRKSIDTWMLTCIVFVFLTLFEFTFLMYLRHVNEKAHAKALESTIESSNQQIEKESVDDTDKLGSNTSLIQKCAHEKDVEKYLRIAKLYKLTTFIVETYGFITVSFGFLLFNIAYWPWLLTWSQYNLFNPNSTFNEPIP